MEEEFKDANLKIIWIGFQDRIERLRKFALKHKLKAVGFDRGNKIATSYGISYGAGVIFIDKDGIVQKRLSKGFGEHTIRDNMVVIIP
jgi:hypothetical protein